MKKLLNRLLNNLVDLSKDQFVLKYILPAFAIFFLWGLIGHLYLIKINTNSLITRTGQVAYVVVRFEPGVRFYSVHYPLIIHLKYYPKEFRIPDNYESNFPELQAQILKEDQVILYIRKKWQTILGWGNQADIYQIDKNGKTLFDISKVITQKKRDAILYGILLLILWPWYIYYRLKRRNEMKVNRTISSRN